LPVKVHTFAIIRPSGEPTLICGSLTRSPTGLAGFISALHRLAQELIPETGRQIRTSRYEMMFHNFGHIFVGLIHDTASDFLSAVITDRADVKDISTIIDLSIRFNENFLREIWAHLSDEEKELNAIPIELIEDFELKLAKFLTSREWFSKIRISRYFIRSSTGCVFLRYLLNEIRKRLETFVGRKFLSKVMNKLMSKYGISEEILRLVIYSRPEEFEDEIADITMRCGSMIFNLIKLTQKAFTRRALENIDVLDVGDRNG